ncbi:MAG TPA: peroxidase-related enzyme [Candidatus Thermoplasmatota archaeon]|nr:peroxidase-related enzyme [Candidatus Thermoplasmatota archaeon]
MAWIRIVPRDQASGKLAEEYQRVERERGALANIFMATSLHPGVLDAHLDLYEAIHFGESPLSRRERELIATVVSRENRCSYCVTHHADAFGRHASEPGLQAMVSTDYTKAALSPRERAIADHAALLTRAPSEVSQADVEKLRKAGLDDRAILDVTLTAAYFAFANRLASGLGLTAEDVAKGYRY